MDKLAYYKTQSYITDPKNYSEYFNNLSNSVEDVVKIVQGIIVDKDLIGLYGETISENQKEDMDTRYVSDIMSIIIQRNSSPLTEKRLVQNRFVGSCRDYAIMLCSILRHKKIPARLRCGFDNYFNITSSLYDDHWICEYWNEVKKRWACVDANVDEIVKEKYKISINMLNISSNKFIVAGKAWQMARSGDADPNSFGVSSIDIKGLWFIRGSVVRDIASLNKFEALPWDYWGIADKELNDFSDVDLDILDNAAKLSVAAGTLDELDKLSKFDSFVVPKKIKSYSPIKGLQNIVLR